jgi:hypothetical protein
MRLPRTASAALFFFACSSFAAAAHAAEPYAPPASPTAPSEAAAPAPAAPAPGAEAIYDDVLRRLLRSGCHDGLVEARILASRASTPWAETVVRLCGEILAPSRRTITPITPLTLPPPPSFEHHRERDGRGTLVIASTIYGIWAGIAIDVLFTIDGVRTGIIPPLLGMGAGLALSLGLTSDRPVTNGQAWSTVTGLEYGSLNGAFWSASFDFSSKKTVGWTLATGLVGGAAGIVVANKVSPTQGDVEVVRSGLLWGTLGGLLGVATFAPHASQKTVFRVAAASMDFGFLAGLALAASFDVSRNRDLIIDAGTLGGGVAGLGITVLAAGTNGSGQGIAAGTLGGMMAGMLLTIFLTRDMDEPDSEPGSPVAALIGRDARGRWHLGTPGPTPVLDGLGHRIVGATFNALGGSF